MPQLHRGKFILHRSRICEDADLASESHPRRNRSAP
jgi:hypothetical protein